MIYLQAILGLALILLPFILARPAKPQGDSVELMFDRRQASR